MHTSGVPRRIRRVLPDQSGQALVEALIVAALLTGLLATVIYLGRIGSTHVRLSAAARVGAFGGDAKVNDASYIPFSIPAWPRSAVNGDGVRFSVDEPFIGKTYIAPKEDGGDDQLADLLNKDYNGRLWPYGVAYQLVHGSVWRVLPQTPITRDLREVTASRPVIGLVMSGGGGLLQRWTLEPSVRVTAARDPWDFSFPLGEAAVTAVYSFSGILYGCFGDKGLKDSKDLYCECYVDNYPSLDALKNKILEKLGSLLQETVREGFGKALDVVIEKVPSAFIKNVVLYPLKEWVLEQVEGFLNGLLKQIK